MVRSRGGRGIEALEMLRQDHDEVEKAFREFEKRDRGEADALRELVMATCEDLRLHTALEEEIFYPALREAIEDEDLLNEAAVEHETAKMLVEQLENMPEDDPNFHATFVVLGEYVRHHIKEEESELFAAARKAALDFEGLAARMRERKEALIAEAHKAHA